MGRFVIGQVDELIGDGLARLAAIDSFTVEPQAKSLFEP